MATKVISFEEAMGETSKLVPAKRTPRGSSVLEELPKFNLNSPQSKTVVPENEAAALLLATQEQQGGDWSTETNNKFMQLAMAGKPYNAKVIDGKVVVEEASDKPRKKIISFEEAMGPVPIATEVKEKSFLDNSIDAVKDVGKRTFETIMSRINEAPKTVQRTPAEIEFMLDEEVKEKKLTNPSDIERYKSTRRDHPFYTTTQAMASEEDVAKLEVQNQKDATAQAGRAKATEGKGFIPGLLAALRNPVENILTDSLPADMIKDIARAPEHERIAYEKVRQSLMQQNIVDNPNKFPAVAVEAATKAIEARKSKQTPTLRKAWSDLHQAATENPALFGAELINALTADPEMLLAPMGTGAKVIAGTRKMATGAETTSKLIQMTDRVLDAGATGAAMNVAIESADRAGRGAEFTQDDFAISGMTGFLMSGPLGPLFLKGARGRNSIKNAGKGTLSEADYEKAMRDAAREELLVEDIIEAPSTEIIFTPDGKPVPAAVRDRIEIQLGIKSATGEAAMSPAQRQALLKKTREEWKKQFANDWENLDHQKFKAEERIARRELLGGEAAERKAAQAAAKQIEDTRNALAQTEREAKAKKFAEDFDKAILAKDEQAMALVQEQALRDNVTFDTVKKIEADDIFAASVDKNTPAVKQMLAKAQRRDPKTWKYQGGSIDPELALRLGLTGTAASIGFALAPEDKKMQGGFLGLLLGLTIPGGGSKTVLSRMRQSGAVSPDGNIAGLMFKKDKLPNEAGVIERAKVGDQQAYAELYNQYFPRLERASRQFVREAGPKLGIEPADIAQDTFVKAFKELPNFKGDSEFYTWIHSIMRNEGLQAIRKADSRIDTTSMFNSGSDAGPGSLGAGHILEGDLSLVKSNVESASSNMDTPETATRAAEVEAQLEKAIAKLPEKERIVLKLKELEGFDDAEIAQKLGTSEANVRAYATRARTNVLAEVAKDLGVGKGPKYQRGEVDPRLLKVGAVAAIGAGAYGFLDSENKKLAAGLTALTAAALIFSKGRAGEPLSQGIIEGLDKTLGIMSTRVMNISKPVWWRTMEHFRTVLKDTHAHMKEVDPFLVQLENLEPEAKGLIQRAILTGNQGVTQRLLDAVGNPELLKGWKAVRATLDTLGDQLVHLKRFKRGGFEYFPRIVKDVSGLLTAMGKEKGDFLSQILRDANAKSLSNRGMELSDIERSKIINDALMSEPKLGGQPGFAKDRAVREITPELQKFYATPTESLHSYIRSAVEDIQTAKFFGKDLEVVKKGDSEYTNVDKSIGKMVLDMQASGQLTDAQANDLSGMLKTLFLNDKGVPNEIIQKAKNLSYAGLLGNPLSAISQLSDVVIQAYIQDTRSALVATTKMLTGRNKLNPKDFGLSDHLAEEFVSTDGTARFLHKALKFGLFSKVDLFGKGVALNAAVNKLGRMSKGEMGIKNIEAKYNAYLQPGEIKQLVKDLQNGETTDIVRAVAFAEMSRTQPITKFEMPQAYVDHPNGRVLYQFKSFMLKQLDVVRRDAFNEIKKGNIATGVKNLTMIGIALGVGGMSTEKIKKFFMNSTMSLLGHTPAAIEFQASDIPMNMLKTFGLSEYILDKASGMSKEQAAIERENGNKYARPAKPDVAGAMLDMVSTPGGQVADVMTANPKILRYIPWIGPFLYEDYRLRKAEEKEE